MIEAPDTPPAIRKKVTAATRAAYLAELARSGSHPAACKAIGYSRRTMASHIESHNDFAEEVEDAKALFASKLLEEATRRAVTGLEGELVLHEGAPVRDPENPSEYLRKPRRYSDKLLALMLSRVGPDSFRAPTKVEHTHTGIVAHVVAVNQSAMLARMSVSARLEYYSAEIVQSVLTGALPHSAAVRRIAELVGEAQANGIELDGLAIAKEARLGKFAELPAPAIDAEFEDVGDEECPNFL